MKKNKLFILGLVTVFVALVSLTLVSSTWAKYTTNVNGSDSARVAYWGFKDTSMIAIDDLFDISYDTNKVLSTTNVIAPGTKKTDTFSFKYTEGVVQKPEVAYQITVSIAGSSCEQAIKDNADIRWSLTSDGTEVYNLTWAELLVAILELSGAELSSDQKDAVAAGTLKEITVDYAANTLPAKLDTEVYTIGWQWQYAGSDNDSQDTAMGNAASPLNVALAISITATQID